MKVLTEDITEISGGESSNLFWRAVHQLEDLFGIDLPTPNDYEQNKSQS